MEGILSVSAALQGRGAARDGFKAVVGASPNLKNAQAIVDKALGGGVGMNVVDRFGDETFTWLPVDHEMSYPSAELKSKAKELRETTNGFTSAITHLDANSEKEAALESAWQSMIQTATGGGSSHVR
jgi:hypothetical protein